MKRRIMSTFLAVMLVWSCVPLASAASAEANTAANDLHDLGLFGGVGTNADGSINYDLDRTMTRAEAVTMLVRLLGKEEEAKAGTWQTPFTDVADWAKPYVGYAYAHNLTGGVAADKFGGAANTTATQYLTFVLRALGYSSETDFQWDRAWELTDRLGITAGQYGADTNFMRADAVIISRNALYANINGTSANLLSSLGVSGDRAEKAQYNGKYPGGSILFQQDDDTYISEFSDIFYQFSIGNKTDIYVMSPFVESALAIATNDFTYGNASNPYYAGTIAVYPQQSESFNGVSTLQYSKFHVVRTEIYTGKDISYSHFEIDMGTKKLAFDDPDGTSEGLEVRSVSGIKSIDYWGRVYLNLADLVDYFGLNTAFLFTETTDGHVLKVANKR